MTSGQRRACVSTPTGRKRHGARYHAAQMSNSGQREVPEPESCQSWIQADTCDSGGIREISGDCWLLAAPQNFPQRFVHF